MRPKLAPIALAFVLVACGSSEERQPYSTTTDGGPTPGTGASSSSGGASSSSGTATSATKGDGSVGSACAVKTDCDQTVGLDCLTEIPAVPAAGFAGMKFPGGMCTKKCGQPNPDSPNPADQDLTTDCGKNGVCIQSSQSTGQGGMIQMQMCMRTCAGHSDCRTMDGYSCVSGAFGQKTCKAP
jgi:hypothetical protein